MSEFLLSNQRSWSMPYMWCHIYNCYSKSTYCIFIYLDVLRQSLFPSRANPMSADRQMFLTSTSQCERTESTEISQSPKNHKSEKKVYATIAKREKVCVSHVHQDTIFNKIIISQISKLTILWNGISSSSIIMVIAKFYHRQQHRIVASWSFVPYRSNRL